MECRRSTNSRATLWSQACADTVLDKSLSSPQEQEGQATGDGTYAGEITEGQVNLNLDPLHGHDHDLGVDLQKERDALLAWDFGKIYNLSDVSNLMVSDVELTFSDIDFSAIDLDMFEAITPGPSQSAIVWPPEHDHNQIVVQTSPENTASASHHRRSSRQPGPQTRSEAFRRSQWASWHPSKLQHAFTGQDVIDAGEVSASSINASISSIDSANYPVFVVEHEIDEHGRDNLLRLAMGINKASSRLSVSSFPSLELLNNLISAFFAQEHEAVASSVGTWSGVHRKTEIATGCWQSLYIMLRSSGAMDQSYYEARLSGCWDSHDERNTIESRWRLWASVESMKRLVIRAFIHDSQAAMAFLHGPVIPYAYMNIPVPATTRAWLASDADSWKQSARLLESLAEPQLNLTEVFVDPTVLDRYYEQADAQLSCFAAVHALAGQVWELRHHFALRDHASSHAYDSKRRSLESRCRSRQRELYDDLLAMRLYCRRRLHPPHFEISFTLEYVMMTLHVSVLDIQRFAGKEGETEARRAGTVLREWRQELSARTAVWHAGQVFRMARSFPPTTLRDFYAVGTYHAALTLWVYGLLSCPERLSGSSTPAAGTNPEHCPRPMERTEPMTAFRSGSAFTPGPRRLVKLDREGDEDSEAFIRLGQGTPGICSGHPGVGDVLSLDPGLQAETDGSDRSQFHALSEPAFVMEAAGAILRNNWSSVCHGRQGQPLLGQTLTHLTSNLASLSPEL
ncbi:hypothetical protein Daus18300_010900 [Diaporthe australafricana]|uniref:Transcription factor domain-containing protein n=1 Tax=Diaporthe australafricana TaxID=127596 RepID=A0ABR3W8V2_9PEZI